MTVERETPATPDFAPILNKAFYPIKTLSLERAEMWIRSLSEQGKGNELARLAGEGDNLQEFLGHMAKVKERLGLFSQGYTPSYFNSALFTAKAIEYESVSEEGLRTPLSKDATQTYFEATIDSEVNKSNIQHVLAEYFESDQLLTPSMFEYIIKIYTQPNSGIASSDRHIDAIVNSFKSNAQVGAAALYTDTLMGQKLNNPRTSRLLGSNVDAALSGALDVQGPYLADLQNFRHLKMGVPDFEDIPFPLEKA